jgi:hypothetical protein
LHYVLLMKTVCTTISKWRFPATLLSKNPLPLLPNIIPKQAGRAVRASRSLRSHATATSPPIPNPGIWKVINWNNENRITKLSKDLTSELGKGFYPRDLRSLTIPLRNGHDRSKLSKPSPTPTQPTCTYKAYLKKIKDSDTLDVLIDIGFSIFITQADYP